MLRAARFIEDLLVGNIDSTDLTNLYTNNIGQAKALLREMAYQDTAQAVYHSRDALSVILGAPTVFSDLVVFDKRVLLNPISVEELLFNSDALFNLKSDVSFWSSIANNSATKSLLNSLISDPGSKLKREILTSGSGFWNTPVGTRALVVMAIAPGGQGGECALSGEFYEAGGSGGAGEFAIYQYFVTENIASQYSYIVGQASTSDTEWSTYVAERGTDAVGRIPGVGGGTTSIGLGIDFSTDALWQPSEGTVKGADGVQGVRSSILPVVGLDGLAGAYNLGTGGLGATETATSEGGQGLCSSGGTGYISAAGTNLPGGDGDSYGSSGGGATWDTVGALQPGGQGQDGSIIILRIME